MIHIILFFVSIPTNVLEVLYTHLRTLAYVNTVYFHVITTSRTRQRYGQSPLILTPLAFPLSGRLRKSEISPLPAATTSTVVAEQPPACPHGHISNCHITMTYYFLACGPFHG